MSRPYQPPNPGINKKSTVKRREAGRSNQPIDSIEWVDPHTLHANDFNPNRLSRKDMRLLKISLLESGWLAPVVATEPSAWTNSNADVLSYSSRFTWPLPVFWPAAQSPESIVSRLARMAFDSMR